VIWQNIPAPILNTYFSQISIIQAIYNIGVLPFVLGLYVIYLFSFKKKNKSIYLIMSFAASAGLLLWLRLINLNIGLMFFGIVLVLLFSQWFKDFMIFVKQSRASNFLYLFIALFFIGILVFSVYPSFEMAESNKDKITFSEIAALEWIKKNTPEDAVIIATPREGNLINAVSGRKNVIDTDFLLQPDAEQRFEDIERIYHACLEIEVVEILDKYDADFIYFSDNAKILFEKEELKFIDKCFEKVYDDEVQIYQRKEGCALRVVR